MTPVHDGDAKFEVPVRLTLPAEKQSNLNALPEVRAPDGAGPFRNWSNPRSAREKMIFHKDCCPVFVVGDMGQARLALYGMFDIRSIGTWPSRRADPGRTLHRGAG